MYSVPIEFLRSPLSGSTLRLIDDSTLIDSDGIRFAKHPKFGFWNLIPKSRSPLYDEQQWETFQKLIENFLVSYNRHPEVNVSYAERDDALAFGEFCQYYGKVLDIGCGPHKLPSYIRFRRNSDANYFGVDVVEGEHPKELNFIQAMGEHLPFANDLFDVTISGTSLLHYVDVKAGIREALRVTKPDGYLCVWLGVKSKNAPKPTESPEWYKALQTPEGAENPFHYRRWTSEDFEGFFQAVGGKLVEKKTTPVDQWRENVFFRVKK